MDFFITGVESEDRESVWQSAARLNSSNRAAFQRENDSPVSKFMQMNAK